MNRRAVICLLLGSVVWVTPAGADSIRIGAISNQTSPSRASAGGSINVSSHTPAHSGGPALNGTPGSRAPGSEGGAPAGSEPAFPSISSNSPRYRNPHPFGPGSFWYSAEGHQCVYVPASNGACFNVVQPEAGQPAQPPINPAAIAAGLANQMTLQAGSVAVSPSAHANGLTGAASWFWLEPTPTSESLSLSLRGEHVTVSASASGVQWSFGDGAAITGGAGVPYRAGAAPSGSVRHAYQTRCLPGDQGHDPNVLSGCKASGYQVQATVGWGITYQATGPVPAGGSLPSRSTETSLVYPVSEARAFLTRASGQ
jgi:hypothetical protein